MRVNLLALFASVVVTQLAYGASLWTGDSVQTANGVSIIVSFLSGMILPLFVFER